YDPAIHPPSQRLLAKKMDARVKPAHDGSGTTRPWARARLPVGRDRAKATARIPFGREVVTLPCGYWPRGVLHAGALNGGTNMTFLKTREPVEVETSAETEVEGEIREFVRRDVVGIRRQPESDSELVATNINQLLQRVAGTSVQEIDKLIAEL